MMRSVLVVLAAVAATVDFRLPRVAAKELQAAGRKRGAAKLRLATAIDGSARTEGLHRADGRASRPSATRAGSRVSRKRPPAARRALQRAHEPVAAYTRACSSQQDALLASVGASSEQDLQLRAHAERLRRAPDGRARRAKLRKDKSVLNVWEDKLMPAVHEQHAASSSASRTRTVGLRERARACGRGTSIIGVDRHRYRAGTPKL